MTPDGVQFSTQAHQVGIDIQEQPSQLAEVVASLTVDAIEMLDRNLGDSQVGLLRPDVEFGSVSGPTWSIQSSSQAGPGARRPEFRQPLTNGYGWSR
jgi:hypothetical protein